MSSVSGSLLAFSAQNDKHVNLIINDGKSVTGSTVNGALNIEIFTAGSGSVLPGVDGTATISGAVKISGSVVQAGSLGSTEQLGFGNFAVTDQTGHEQIRLGNGAQTVVGSEGDTLYGGFAVKGKQVVDLTGGNHNTVPGPETVIGGGGPLLVKAGIFDSIFGGSGPLTVAGGAYDTIVAGSGSVVVRGSEPSDGRDHDDDKKHHGRGNNDKNDRDDDDGGKGPGKNGHDRDHDHDHNQPGSGLPLPNHDSIVGGSGPLSVLGGSGDTIRAGTGAMFISGVTASTVAAGAGDTSVIGGNHDTIVDTVAGGTLKLDLFSHDKDNGKSSIAGAGTETVSLGTGHGAATFRDISVNGGSGSAATTTVTGFDNLTDAIASKTSVSNTGEFLGSTSVSAGNTTMTFLDGSKMTLVGVTDLHTIKFVQ